MRFRRGVILLLCGSEEARFRFASAKGCLRGAVPKGRGWRGGMLSLLRGSDGVSLCGSEGARNLII